MRQYKFTTDQLKSIAKKIKILIDSREKKNSHITEYLDSQKIPYETTTLTYGDYSFYVPKAAVGEDIFFHRDVVIERKASLEELSGNLTKERDRFEKEFLKAGNDGAKVYLMIEDNCGYSGIISHKYRTEMTPVSYMASLRTFENRFGANIQFVDKQYSGYYIVSTFQYFLREHLK